MRQVRGWPLRLIIFDDYYRTPLKDPPLFEGFESSDKKSRYKAPHAPGTSDYDRSGKRRKDWESRR